MTFLDEKIIKQQMEIKYGTNKTKTELYHLSGILINRNNHYVYTDTASWPLSCVGTNVHSFYYKSDLAQGFRCELKYDANFSTQKIDDVFGIKANKSNFIFDHVDGKFKDMMELLTSGLINNLRKNGFEQDGLQNSLIGILEEYENLKKEEKRKEEEEEQRKKQKEKEAIERKLKRESQKKQNEERKKREKKEKAEKLEREEEQRLHQEELAKLARQNAEKIAKLKKEKEEEIARILKEERERAKQKQKEKEKAKQKQKQELQEEVSSDDTITSDTSDVEPDNLVSIPDFSNIISSEEIHYKEKGGNLIFEPCNLTQLKNATNKIFKQLNVNDKIIPNSVKYLENLHELYKSLIASPEL